MVNMNKLYAKIQKVMKFQRRLILGVIGKSRRPPDKNCDSLTLLITCWLPFLEIDLLHVT
jgi:hypothetical protein